MPASPRRHRPSPSTRHRGSHRRRSTANSETTFACGPPPCTRGFHATHDAAERTYTYDLYAPADADDPTRTGRRRAVGRRCRRARRDTRLPQSHPDETGTERTVAIDWTRDGQFLVVQLTAGGFCRQLVRRLVSLAAAVADGSAPLSKVDRILSPEPVSGPDGVPPAPPEPLVLTDVRYPNVSFTRDEDAAVDARTVFARRRATARTTAGSPTTSPTSCSSRNEGHRNRTKAGYEFYPHGATSMRLQVGPRLPLATDEDWEAAYEEAEELIEDLSAYGDGPSEDAATLLETLETYEDRCGPSRTSPPTPESTGRGHDRRHVSGTDRPLTVTLVEASSAASFLDPELQDLDYDDIEAMVDEEPALEPYEHYFDDVLRMKDHTRSAEVENLLAELGEVTGAPGEVYNMLANADMTFPTVEDPDGDQQPITLSNFTTLQKHPDRDFRQRVYEAFYDEWETVRNAVGTAYKNAVKTDVKMANARDYDTAREAALDGPNVPVEVYDTLATPSTTTSRRSTATPTSNASQSGPTNSECGTCTPHSFRRNRRKSSTNRPVSTSPKLSHHWAMTTSLGSPTG